MKRLYHNTRSFISLALVVLLILALLLFFPVRGWIRTVAFDQLQEKAGVALNVYTGDLQIELDKFKALPYILSKNPLFLQAILHPDDKLFLDKVNGELQRINSLAETSAIYILDATGRCLVASNWDDEISFIGEYLGFRPYYKEAMQGMPGRYFAVGVMSKVRGYYFAAPIYSGEEVVGVLTVKVHLQRLEANWAQGAQRVVVTDPAGVIFISSYTPWRFKALAPLSGEAIEALQKSLRYGDITPDFLGTKPLFEDKQGFRYIELEPKAVPAKSGTKIGRSGFRFLVRSREMPEAGWTVHVLADIAPVEKQVRNSVLLAAFLPVVLLLIGLLLYSFRQARAKEEAIEAQARHALQKMNEQLEQHVCDRTRELTLANRYLTREVQERRKTEKELRATHDELIQAGKLASIGRMATSIAHETSQPLAAIRMFAENSLILLDEHALDQVRLNLQDIADLVVKMSHITSHLKSFARKSEADFGKVSLSLAIKNVRVLLDMAIRKIGATLDSSVDEELHVLADPVLLEQVFLNILSNALDAIADQSEKNISITAMRQGKKVKITVRDTGPGIVEQYLDDIFEPFFTQKQNGKGLGLGLSLSRSIINDFGGRIVGENSPERGAVFHIILPAFCGHVEVKE